LSKDNARLISREVITHTKKGVVADQFYWPRTDSMCSKRGSCRRCRSATRISA
jgi:hypothetical protein